MVTSHPPYMPPDDVKASVNEIETGPSVHSIVEAVALTGHSCPLEPCILMLAVLNLFPVARVSLYLPLIVMTGF